MNDNFSVKDRKDVKEELAAALDKIEWTEFTSLNGEKFEVGFLEDEVNSDRNRPSNKAVSKEASWKVHWPCPSRGDTMSPMEDFTCIEKWSLEFDTTALSVYKHILRIKNIWENYTYHFIDETKDSYKLSCHRKGWHYVRYNSKKPTIIEVKYK